LKILFSKSFQRDYKKFSKKDINFKQKVDETIEIFRENHQDRRLFFKHIICKRDKFRYSIRVINTQYRILMTCINDICEFRFLLDHDEYDRKNKNC